jgi:hypothetical protein
MGSDTPHVPIPQVASLSQHDDMMRVVGPQDIYDEWHRQCMERLHPVNIDEFLALGDYYDEVTQRVYPERVIHELRMREFPVSEAGIVKGSVKKWMLIANIQYALNTYQDEIAQEQPGCTWRLIGFRLQRVGQQVSTEIPYDGQRYSVAGQDALLGRGIVNHQSGLTRPVAIDRSIDYREDEDWRAKICVVYGDIARGQVRDPNVQHEKDWDGPGIQYARTRCIRHLSDGSRRRREDIVELLRSIYPKARPKEEPTPAPMPQVQQVSVAGSIDVEVVRQLRRGGEGKPPMKPDAIAKHLGVDKVHIDNILKSTSHVDS